MCRYIFLEERYLFASLVYYQIWKFSGCRVIVGYDRTAKYSFLLPIASSLGYIFTKSMSGNLSNIMFVMLYYLTGIFWAYVGAKFIHKYFFMKYTIYMVKFERARAGIKR